MSKRKSTIDSNLGQNEKATGDLRRACISALELLKTGAIHTALYTLDNAVRSITDDLLIKNRIPCNPTSNASGRRLKPLKKPGPIVPKPSIKRRTSSSGSASS